MSGGTGIYGVFLLFGAILLKSVFHKGNFVGWFSKKGNSVNRFSKGIIQVNSFKKIKNLT